MEFAKKFFSKLHGNFQIALQRGNLTTCLLISYSIEAFAILLITLYKRNILLQKITEGVVKDEYLHLNYGQEWLKENLSTCRRINGS